LSIKTIGRSSGRSSVAAAAYRAGELIKDERTGLTHDYSHKGSVTYTSVILPPNAPIYLKNRSTLWNEVEKSEKRKDARTAREIEVALPKELSLNEHVRLLENYIRENFILHGMIADFAIHHEWDANPHAHIMLTTRNVNRQGFGGKNRGWDNKAYAETWRKSWADNCNRALEQNQVFERIDHRSYERQGIDQLATIHLGAAAHQLEKRGIKTERGKFNAEVINLNREVKRMGLEIDNVTRSIQSEQKALRDMFTNYIAEQPKPDTGRQRPNPNQYSAPKQTVEFFSDEKIKDLRKAFEHTYGKIIELDAARESMKGNLDKAPGEIRNLSAQITQLERVQKTVSDCDKQLKIMVISRAQLGLFSRSKRNKIDEDIEQLKSQKVQAIGSIASFKVNMTDLPQKIESLYEDRKKLEDLYEKVKARYDKYTEGIRGLTEDMDGGYEFLKEYLKRGEISEDVFNKMKSVNFEPENQFQSQALANLQRHIDNVTNYDLTPAQTQTHSQIQAYER